MVADGVTLLLQVPLPVPVTVPPPLFRVNVQAPEAVTFPVMVVLFPLQIAVLALVTEAVGRELTVIRVEPVRSAAIEMQLASDKEEMV